MRFTDIYPKYLQNCTKSGGLKVIQSSLLTLCSLSVFVPLLAQEPSNLGPKEANFTLF